MEPISRLTKTQVTPYCVLWTYGAKALKDFGVLGWFACLEFGTTRDYAKRIIKNPAP